MTPLLSPWVTKSTGVILGCIRVKVPWKEGFAEDRAMYKSRKRYKELKKQEAHNQFKEWYALEKEKRTSGSTRFVQPTLS